MECLSKFVQGRRRRLSGLAGLMSLLLVCSGALAQEPAAPLTLEDVNAKADVATLAGHNAWMLTSSALVLFMTAPGLAMFYGGLVRKKNVLGVIMQCLFLMAMMTVIWRFTATHWLLAIQLPRR